MAKTVNQLAKILPTSWDANSSVHYSKLTDAVNGLLGYNGPAVISNSLDVQGNPVQNVAAPKLKTDALNLGTAESKYSPAVVGPHLDVGGKNALPGLTYLYFKKHVDKIIAGTGISISPASGTGEVTITNTGGGGGGVTKIVAGTNVTISPAGGTGVVTVNSSSPVVPVNTPAVPHQFFTAYNAITGGFSESQPSFSDVFGVADPSQLPLATSSTFGVVEPDNSTITVSGGVVSATSASGVPFRWSNIFLGG